MKAPVLIDGLIVDNFAGGGGASTGIEAAAGRSVDIAINHDPEAVALHKANHPDTRHYCQSVWRADPIDVTEGKRVALAWFSPDCKHFSKAKGGKPVEKHIRDLAWVVVHWAKRVKPFVMMLENVEEFQTWGPLRDDGRPDPAQKGKIFKTWVGQLRRLGYRVQWREMRACDYGAPTSRKRLFLIARCDGQPIVWPKPTHGKPGTPDVLAGKLLPWRTAASIIDWSIPCPSIFERARPLKDATCRRIAAGIKRYVLDAAKPFIVPITHSGGDGRVHDVADPLRTVTTAARGELAVTMPYFARTAHGDVDRNGKRRGRGDHGVEETFPTVTSSQDSALITPTMVQIGYGEREGQAPRALDIEAPLGTVVAGGAKHAVVSPVIVGCGGRRAQSAPVDPEGAYPTTTAKADACVVAAFMEKFSQNSRGKSPEVPLDTAMAGAPRHGVVAVHMAQHNSERSGVKAGRSVDDPISTVTSSGSHQSVAASSIVKLRGTSKDGQPSDEPLHTISAGGLHHAEVRAFMIKYYGNEEGGHGLDKPLGTATTKERFGLVTVEVDGEPYAIVDIGMRMLSARELFAAQGFPASYVIDPIVDGKPLTKTAQIRMCGNSVCPPMSEALVRANFAAVSEERVAA